MTTELDSADRWMRRLQEAGESVTNESDGEGRVLRLKLGYNPNSSSVGSVVTTLLWSATAGAAALNIAAALIRERARGDQPAGTPEDDAGTDE